MPPIELRARVEDVLAFAEGEVGDTRHGPGVTVDGVTWRIRCEVLECDHNNETEHTLGFFVRGDVDGDSTEWKRSFDGMLRVVCLKAGASDHRDRSFRNGSIKADYFFGYNSFMLFDKLLDATNGFCVDDAIELYAEVNVHSVEGVPPLLDVAVRDADTSGKLFESKNYTDFTIVVGGEELTCHRDVLANASPVFDAMFKADMKESKEQRLHVEDIAVDTMKELLRFAYTGVWRNDAQGDMAVALLLSAEKYGMPALKTSCAANVPFDTENVCARVRILHLHGCADAKRRAFKFVKAHLKEVVATAGWAQMPNDELMQELVVFTGGAN